MNNRERQRRRLLKVLTGTDDKIRKDALESLKQIHDDPHVCDECWSGRVYLDDHLLCDCTPGNVMNQIVAGLKNGVIIESTDDGEIKYLTTIKRHYAIYDHPTDFPEHWIVRGWEIREGLYEPHPDAEPILLKSLAAAHLAVKKLASAARLIDREDPDPNIAEVWAEI